MTSQPNSEHGASRRSLHDLVGSHAISWLLLAILLGTLVHFAGIWNVLANTRLLDLLISSGIIGYHDLHQGIVTGIPDHELYLFSQDPVDWRLVTLVAALYFLFWGIKALQFHGIARFLGMKGKQSEHTSASYYGVGFNILCPGKAGNAAVVSSCEAHGEDPGLAGTAVYTQELFVLFEVAVFALIGLVLNGWSTWLGQLFWAFAICAVAYLITRPAQIGGILVAGRATREDRKAVLRRLFDSPKVLVVLAVLSLFAFLIDDFTPYLISQAFTNDFVILNVSFAVIQMGVVAGYIARQVTLTPGGIGQWEWGFAAALYMGGVGLPEAATIAILESIMRHGTGLVLFSLVVLSRRARASARDVTRWALGTAEVATGPVA
ncbi:MAG: flippase-like domain-containing protein [Gemmatimonadetes bacterium]|nr:flippase-like domain-containing protein [Gemmatimonadota bacterium]MCK5483875.1 flippase-like domain-containing protein [Gemmatimonadota bacterium]